MTNIRRVLKYKWSHIFNYILIIAITGALVVVFGVYKKSQILNTMLLIS